jgi:membrane associated rhomboid family serine protease
LFASVLHVVFNFNSSVPAVGASGAISGVMGAYLIFYPEVKIKMLLIDRIVRVPASLFFIAWFFFQLVFALTTVASNTTASIAWFAHIGGFIFGAFVAFYKRKSAPVVEAESL